jgi:hypothetical protein
MTAKALKQLQAEKPAYQGDDGAQGWWWEVIRRTAIGAGADSQGSYSHIFYLSSIKHLLQRSTDPSMRLFRA